MIYDPSPHHCTERPRADGPREGCPRWPACVFAEQPVEPEPGLAESLAGLAGLAGGAVIFLVVVAILLPLFV